LSDLVEQRYSILLITNYYTYAERETDSRTHLQSSKSHQPAD